MRNHLLVAGIAAAALVPSFALAQTSCEQQHDNRIASTVGGGVIGALLGSAVAGHGDKTTGAVIGGVGGAVIGNQVGKGAADCAHAYGYYDKNGAWHATAAERHAAQGYYDREGQWIAGPPNGYYDSQNRWVSANTAASTSGYYDGAGRWVPASASGYYDTDGRWVAGTASGHYSNGRWIAGPAIGRYDASGRWIEGQPSGHRDASGVWVADAQPGYYDSNGRWRAGQAVGYYDARGRWIATAASAERLGYDTNERSRADWQGRATADPRSRMAWLDQTIRREVDQGSLSRHDGRRALRSLNSIRRDEARMPRRYGQMRQQDQLRIQARLDELQANIGSDRDSHARYD